MAGNWIPPRLLKENPKGCDSEVVLGTLYCFDQPTEQAAAAEYRAEEGQLVWSTLGGVRPPFRYALALTLADEQVRLQEVRVDLGFLGLRVEQRGRMVDAKVAFADLIEAIHGQNGPREWVNVVLD